MVTTEQCPDCGSDVEIDSMAGFCSICLLGSVVESNENRTSRTEMTTELPWDIKIPGLKLGEIIGRGSMGIVFKAHQPLLDRHVAVKVLNPLLSEEDEFVERFFDEAQAMAALNHPNIVTVFDIGKTEEGALYIEMEWIEGTDLRSLIQQGEISTEHALKWVPQICEALQAAHDRGIVHRDVKPSNIMITLGGEVRVTDFGIAKLTENEGLGSFTSNEIGLGTPDYVAPEQLNGNHTSDHRADLYSLGVTLFEMLTGTLPGISSALPSEISTTADRRFDPVVERAMKINPKDRYQSATEITQDLQYMTSNEVKLRREKLKQKWALGSMLMAVVILSAVCANMLIGRPKTVPQPVLVTSTTPKVVKPESVNYQNESESYQIRPWRDADLWGESAPGKFPKSAVNSGFKDKTFIVENSTTLLTEEMTKGRLRIFGGRDLILNPTTSLEIWGSGDGVTVVPNLVLSGGRLAAGQSIPSETDLPFFPSYMKRALFPSKPLTERDLFTMRTTFRVIGDIQVNANSLLDVGLRKTESINLDARITGASTLSVRRRAGRGTISIPRDNPKFSGGWRIAGWCTTDSPLALGTGPVHVEKGGFLFVKSPLKLTQLTVEPGGNVISDALIETQSFLDATNYRKENPDQKLEIDFTTEKQAAFRGTGKIKAERQAAPVSHDGIIRPESGPFWEKPESYVTLEDGGKADWTTATWKGGEAPSYLKISNNQFLFEQLSDYSVPPGKTLRTPSAIRDSVVFGGKSLTLQKNSTLLFQSGDGLVNFPRLISDGGEIAVCHKGNFKPYPTLLGVLEVPTHLTLRTTEESEQVVFSLKSQLRGNGEITIDIGNSCVSFFQPLKHFTGIIRVKSGTLYLNDPDFKGATFILEEGASLFNTYPAAIAIGHLQAHPESLITSKRFQINIKSLKIGNQQISAGSYNSKTVAGKLNLRNIRLDHTLERALVIQE